MREELFGAFVSQISIISMIEHSRNVFDGHTYLWLAPSSAYRPETSCIWNIMYV